MAHCRSPAKCLKNGHFPSNQIQIVPDSNCCKLFMDNRLPARTNFSPDTSVLLYNRSQICDHIRKSVLSENLRCRDRLVGEKRKSTVPVSFFLLFCSNIICAEFQLVD